MGGEVHTLLGNHEVINLKGRYEYVSKEELRKLGAKDHSGGRVPSAELIQEGRSRWAELMTLVCFAIPWVLVGRVVSAASFP